MRSRQRPVLICSLLLLALLGVNGCPSPRSGSEWDGIRARRQAALADYMETHRESWQWFADAPLGDFGVPWLMLKVMPLVAEDIWGDGSDGMQRFGLFADSRQGAGWPAPRGIGWTGLFPRENQPLRGLDIAAVTCASCHTGRVKGANGEITYIDGGVNTTFQLVKYWAAIVQTADKIAGSISDPEKKKERIAAVFGEAISKAADAKPSFFYGDVTYNGHRFDSTWEKKQIELFESQKLEAAELLLNKAAMIAMMAGNLYEANYQDIYPDKADFLKGPPGQGDATGISAAANLAKGQKAAAAQGRKAPTASEAKKAGLQPPRASMTDFMSVWRQDLRQPEWDAEGKALVHGGGQWDGNIPIPLFRNFAAASAGMINQNHQVDLRVAIHSAELLFGLPAPPYPFDVDMELAADGKELFARHCASCHRPGNGELYDLGTDLGRAKVITPAMLQRGQADMLCRCLQAREDGKGVDCSPPPEDSSKLEERFTAGPCREFLERPIPVDQVMHARGVDGAPPYGYQALPLEGVWARAPYLHNGSVPTLYHLLVPGERPAKFVRGALEYDTQNVGFRWDPAGEGTDGLWVHDTSIPVFSAGGHDRDLTLADGSTALLDWSDHKEELQALLEYLKTL